MKDNTSAKRGSILCSTNELIYSIFSNTIYISNNRICFVHTNAQLCNPTLRILGGLLGLVKLRDFGSYNDMESIPYYSEVGVCFAQAYISPSFFQIINIMMTSKYGVQLAIKQDIVARLYVRGITNNSKGSWQEK